MKPPHDRTQNLQRRSVAADLAARIAAIFEQYPLLCGFSVQQRSAATDRTRVPLPGKLCLAEVTAPAPRGYRVTQEFRHQIAQMLIELLEEQPDVFDLLSGRTFARTFH